MGLTVRLLAVMGIVLIPWVGLMADAMWLTGCYEVVPTDVMTRTRLMRTLIWGVTSSAILLLIWCLLRGQPNLTRWTVLALFVLWRALILAIDLVQPPACFESYAWLATAPDWSHILWQVAAVLYPLCCLIAAFVALERPKTTPSPG